MEPEEFKESSGYFHQMSSLSKLKIGNTGSLHIKFEDLFDHLLSFDTIVKFEEISMKYIVWATELKNHSLWSKFKLDTITVQLDDENIVFKSLKKKNGGKINKSDNPNGIEL